MKSPTITAHVLLQNEDLFIWYALMSVLPHVDHVLITDNGSTDHTIQLIKSIQSPKIHLTHSTPTDRAGLVKRRREQIKQTTTDWFMLLDGDEIWSEQNLLTILKSVKEAKPQTMAIACRTRNCVGDIYHFLPESAGHYRILDQVGHLNIRFFRNDPHISLEGEYPLEAYTYHGTPVQDSPSHITFVDTWYLHTTHLPRSSSKLASDQVIDRLKKYKLEIGQQLDPHFLPEVFSDPNAPTQIPHPSTITYSPTQKVIANILTPIKKLKRALT